MREGRTPELGFIKTTYKKNNSRYVDINSHLFWNRV